MQLLLVKLKLFLKTIEKFVPEEYNSNDLYYYRHGGGYYLMSHAIRTAHSNVSSSNSGFGGGSAVEVEEYFNVFPQILIANAK